AIRAAFEARDIEFVGSQGVMLREETAEILKSPAALPLLFDDVLKTLQSGGNLLIIAPPQSRSWQDQEKHFAPYLRRLDKNNIRILSNENELPLWQKYGECRTLNIRHHSCMAGFIYGPHVALILWQMESIVLTKSRAAAAVESARFEYFWGSASKAN